MDPESSVTRLPLVGPHFERKLERLGITKIGDLLGHVPHRYLDFSKSSPIGQVRPGDTLTVKGKVLSFKNVYTRFGKKIQVAHIGDETGEIDVVWFNQPYLVKTITQNDILALSGNVGWFGRKKAFISPEYEKIQEGIKTIHTGRLIPVYPETAGVSSKWLRSRINAAFTLTENYLKEFLPSSTLKNLGYLSYKDAISAVHFPKNLADSQKGKERLAFNELLFIQLGSLARKISWQKNKAAYQLNINKKIQKEFTDILPFTLTPSQETAVEEILNDLSGSFPMNRLLEGDVGSGKTVVAASAAFGAFVNGFQSVFMAPTQILAQQHFDTLSKLFEPFKIRVALITSDNKRLPPGRVDIFVGTHALIHKKVPFDKVALVVIDEQHRFGVEQRAHLIKASGVKKIVPHVLTMTATPIPRTVALSLYADLDLSTLKELPQGRQKITTWVVPPQKRTGAYKWIKKEIKNQKVQAFVICPLIEESEVETLKSVKAVSKEYENIKRVFKNMKVGLLHGKLKPKEKEKTVKAFREGEIDILVSTPVVEVGIDVANATIMVIEGSERFGLAQLHQLRGRVGRGNKKSYCLLFSEARGKIALTRLSAMQKDLSGFELAELDLKLRGPGEIYGLKQHGFSQLKIASWSDFELIKKAKSVAQKAFDSPYEFSLLFEKIKKTQVIQN